MACLDARIEGRLQQDASALIGQIIDCRNPALAQACAFHSSFAVSMSDIAIFVRRDKPA
jgi:hypothetical protein